MRFNSPPLYQKAGWEQHKFEEILPVKYEIYIYTVTARFYIMPSQSGTRFGRVLIIHDDFIQMQFDSPFTRVCYDIQLLGFYTVVPSIRPINQPLL